MTSSAHRSRVLVVGCQHGDERLGARIHRYLIRNRSSMAGVDYICGNPRAYRANVRYIETDLNRSYGVPDPKSYEQRRAGRILDYIDSGNYDFVLDVHTTTSDSQSFFLATTLNQPIRRIIACSSIQKVVLMPPAIAECSLIGNAKAAVSIEYNKTLARTQEALCGLIDIIRNLATGRSAGVQTREIYSVKDVISLGAHLAPDARNFTLTADGFYPVLIGENTYRDHRGFAADTRTELTV